MNEVEEKQAVAGVGSIFENALTSFQNGAILDLRLKLAIDLLTHSPIYTGGLPAAELVKHALDVGSELVEQAGKRGLLEPIDSTAGQEILQNHIRRHAEFNLNLATEQRRAGDQSLALGRAVRGALNAN